MHAITPAKTFYSDIGAIGAGGKNAPECARALAVEARRTASLPPKKLHRFAADFLIGPNLADPRQVTATPLLVTAGILHIAREVNPDFFAPLIRFTCVAQSFYAYSPGIVNGELVPGGGYGASGSH